MNLFDDHRFLFILILDMKYDLAGHGGYIFNSFLFSAQDRS